MKKLFFLLMVLLSPAIVFGSGVGAYIPVPVAVTVDGTRETVYGDIDYKYDLEPKPGIGIMFKTNMGKSSVFGYSVALEYTQPKADGASTSSDRVDLLNTFEFGIVKKEHFKLWAGPRINIAYEWYINGPHETYGVEVGIAPAIGAHYNINKNLALSFDLDYKFAWQFGEWYYEAIPYDDGTYSETQQGLTARLGFFFRFKE